MKGSPILMWHTDIIIFGWRSPDMGACALQLHRLSGLCWHLLVSKSQSSTDTNVWKPHVPATSGLQELQLQMQMESDRYILHLQVCLSWCQRGHWRPQPPLPQTVPLSPQEYLASFEALSMSRMQSRVWPNYTSSASPFRQLHSPICCSWFEPIWCESTWNLCSS